MALVKPSEREQTQWYFQRSVSDPNAAGELVLFGRSWYNRAGEERAMGICTEQQNIFLKRAPVFEQMLVTDGILLFKCWLTVDQAQQEERFAERLTDPLKRWKLSSIEFKARQKYAEQGQAREVMLRATRSKAAPWTLVDFDDQRADRLTLLCHRLDHIPDHKVTETLVDFPPLGHERLRGQFGTALKPLENRS